ncbi:MAG TPA: helix-turn-helix domain-containing protein [Phycisphaerales bacterium]|nr:helix-turn-helix domain-containing protein [Phycisphaerales bacterium]
MQLLTVDEVAQRLAVSTRSVWRYVSDQKIPKPVKVGGISRFVEAEIDRFVDRLMRERER